MDWHYVENGQQVGPISDSDLEGLVRDGKIGSHTLVWQPGMSEWKSYGDIRGAGTSPLPGSKMAACAECHKPFPEEEMVKYGEAWVCPSCKTIFFQRLKEGGGVAGTLNYAGFWVRFGAKFLDGLILLIPLILLGVGMWFTVWKTVGTKAFPTSLRIFQLLQFALSLFYNTFFIGKYGATPGKMIAGLQIVTAENQKVSYQRACGRACAEILSGMIFYIGYIMVAFDDEKRALHDRICNTRVIKK